MLINVRASDTLFRRLLPTLITKIRHGVIPIDPFLFFFLLVSGMHGASALGALFSLNDVGIVFTTYDVSSFLSFC